ncbi:MAG: nucleoside triphosphate pyrophosphohydrolase [Gammaproteobacteria bacterium]|nr:nucleoside triphosphate pyrophosphohydrolase [Gammaproteobacteria bacterium]
MAVNDAFPTTINSLLEIMTRLRDPESGCPWDQEQDFKSIAPYTVEEAYEVADAIERDDRVSLQDELGDLLFQVVFHAQMASEAGWFDFQDVVAGICRKMTRRHPHVFADEVVEDAEAQTRAWEAHKEKERGADASALDGVPLALPALTRACKIQKRASRVGFDWPSIHGVAEKVEEELEELREEINNRSAAGKLADESGDLLFASVNLVRHAGIDPEFALHQANRKFTRRFHQVEAFCQEAGQSIMETGLDTLDLYWEQAKQSEHRDAP